MRVDLELGQLLNQALGFVEREELWDADADESRHVLPGDGQKVEDTLAVDTQMVHVAGILRNERLTENESDRWKLQKKALEQNRTGRGTYRILELLIDLLNHLLRLLQLASQRLLALVSAAKHRRQLREAKQVSRTEKPRTNVT